MFGQGDNLGTAHLDSIVLLTKMEEWSSNFCDAQYCNNKSKEEGIVREIQSLNHEVIKKLQRSCSSFKVFEKLFAKGKRLETKVTRVENQTNLHSHFLNQALTHFIKQEILRLQDQIKEQFQIEALLLKEPIFINKEVYPHGKQCYLTKNIAKLIDNSHGFESRWLTFEAYLRSKIATVE